MVKEAAMRIGAALVLLFASARALAFGGHDAWLLTMAPGEELFARFGHSAVLLRDRASGKTEVYNFGTFDGSDPMLVPKFLARELLYFLSVSSLEGTRAAYQGRTLVAQHLDLPAAAVDRLVEALRRHALPENRAYLYDHFADNCVTRIRDLLDDVVHGQIREAFAQSPSGTTIRKEMERLLGPIAFERFGISYILGGTIDRPATKWEMMYLPRFLRDYLREVRLTHPDGVERPLVAAERELHGGLEEPTRFERWPLVAVAAGFLLPLALAALAGLRSRAARVATGLVLSVWGLAAGLGGLLMIYLWTTRLPAAQANANLLFTGPVHLVLVPLGVVLAAGRLSERGTRVLRAVLWALLALAGGDLLAHLVGWAEQSHLGLGLHSAAMAALGLAATPPARLRRDE
jgi:hypothetical protein